MFSLDSFLPKPGESIIEDDETSSETIISFTDTNTPLTRSPSETKTVLEWELLFSPVKNKIPQRYLVVDKHKHNTFYDQLMTIQEFKKLSKSSNKKAFLIKQVNQNISEYYKQHNLIESEVT